MIRWFERRQVYAPSRAFDATARDVGRPVEEVWFASANGAKLNGWFFPSAGPAPRSQLVLLHLHGNGGNISHRIHFYRAWLELGLNVFTFDYQGYGRSEGQTSEEGTYQDAQAAVRWLKGRGFEPERVVALGKSLGGGIVGVGRARTGGGPDPAEHVQQHCRRRQRTVSMVAGSMDAQHSL